MCYTITEIYLQGMHV